ncbi:hypothetical protein D5S17_19060 [Pseudonocardiaceae bacterium YIM PH 21723]|nr:hypothetical protein D5S17_19060 [Pseudonocardiaceae bacterium YIM PH 21723]
MYSHPIEPFRVYTEPIALRWVGLPLAAITAGLLLWFGTNPTLTQYALCGAVTILLGPARRMLSLQTLHVIVRGVRFPGGVVRDRAGNEVAGQSYWALLRTWYVHEYTGTGVLDVLFIKTSVLVAHLVAWPVTLLVSQVHHTMAAQDCQLALGHESDGAGGAGWWLSDLGEGRPLQHHAHGI